MRGAARYVLLGSLLASAGCAVVKPNEELPVTEPPRARVSQPSPEIIGALKCISASHALDKLRFAVAIHADGTGKTANGYEGATGAFLPQGTSAVWATQAVLLAGGQAQNFYELNTERALRQFGGKDVDVEYGQRGIDQEPDYIVSTSFTALDFVGGPSMTLQVAGVGPQAETSGAALEAAAEIYRPGDRRTLAVSSLGRQVRYQLLGVSGGLFAGPGAGTLVTGALSWTDQQKLQSATRDVVALSVADVIARVPGVPAPCRALVDALKAPAGDISEPVATAPKWETPARASASQESAGFMVQVGIAEDQGQAQGLAAHARRLSPSLDGAVVLTEAVQQSHRVVWRARFAGLSRDTASRVCDDLAISHIPCEILKYQKPAEGEKPAQSSAPQAGKDAAPSLPSGSKATDSSQIFN